MFVSTNSTFDDFIVFKQVSQTLSQYCIDWINSLAIIRVILVLSLICYYSFPNIYLIFCFHFNFCQVLHFLSF